MECPIKEKNKNYETKAIIDQDRSNDRIKISNGSIIKEVKTVIFDNTQKKKLLQLITD